MGNNLLSNLIVGSGVLLMVVGGIFLSQSFFDENSCYVVLNDNQIEPCDAVGFAKEGQYVITHIDNPENGRIAVRVDVPLEPRFEDSAPVVFVASTWFVEKYNEDETPFHLVYNPVDVGAISVSSLWPGKTDSVTGIKSDGVYDFGGPDSLAAMRDVIKFSLGEIPDVHGNYLNDLVEVNALYDNVGMFASSHAGVVATNVMAYYGEEFSNLKYFVGRENPTMVEMYALEIGHWDEDHNRVANPYYNHEGYTQTSIDVDYSNLGWTEDNPLGGRPYYEVPNGEDYILDYKGPQIDGKWYFSPDLTLALFSNGVFTLENWPNDLVMPGEAADFWSYREPINNYELVGEKLPDLKVLLPFATYDHVQAASDKPHIHQAYDGFHERAGLWTRLNCDLSYTQSEISGNASIGSFPDNTANTEPVDWYLESESWGFTDTLDGKPIARTVPLAGIAEMVDRVQFNNWEENLDEVLYMYN